MTFRWTAVARMVAAALGVGVASVRARAQSVTIALTPSLGDSVSPAPVISVNGIAVGPEFANASVTLEMSVQPSLSGPFFVQATNGLSGQFQLDTLMAPGTTIFFRARLIDATGTVRAQTVFSRVVRSWLRLVAPTRSLDVLFTRTPTFVWSSPGITQPPGPWRYDVTILNRLTGAAALSLTDLSDTTLTLQAPLDACTSFAWTVTAHALGEPRANVPPAHSPGSFVIQTAECPSVTTFYQNFPNPFGRGERADTTCFWFDLRHRSTVSLIVYDIRLRPVRTIVPNPQLAAQLDSGVYGRQNQDNDTGCDDKVLWDGRDASGRFVPPGVYLAVFRADGVTQSRKILYKGP